MNNMIYNTIIFFIIIMILVYSIKPTFLYNESTSSFRSFGLSDDETIFTLPILGIMLAIVLYIFFLVLNVLYIYLEK